MEFLKGAVYLEGERSIGIVLFHAYTGSTADMNLLARELQREGYHVLIPLFLGHGTDDIFELLQATPDVWWAQAQACILYLKEKVKTVMAFGLSMGGVFATRAMLEPSLNLVAGGSFNSPIMSRGKLNLESPFMAYAQALYQRKKQMSQFELEQAQIRVAHYNQMAQILSFVEGYQNQLLKLQQPYYIAQSGQDELIDPDDAYELQNALEEAAEIDFNWFPENTHAITVNPKRSDFEQSLKRFIERNLEQI